MSRIAILASVLLATCAAGCDTTEEPATIRSAENPWTEGQLAVAYALRTINPIEPDVPNPDEDKVPRSECTECNGTGKVRQGDGHVTDCVACYADQHSFSDGETWWLGEIVTPAVQPVKIHTASYGGDQSGFGEMPPVVEPVEPEVNDEIEWEPEPAPQPAIPCEDGNCTTEKCPATGEACDSSCGSNCSSGSCSSGSCSSGSCASGSCGSGSVSDSAGSSTGSAAFMQRGPVRQFFLNRQPVRTFFRNGGFFRRGIFRGGCRGCR